MVSFLTKVNIFRFWPKTMDYNKAFLPKSSSFSELFLLLIGRSYEAEIFTTRDALLPGFVFHQSQNFG